MEFFSNTRFDNNSKPSSRHRHRSTPHDGTILFNIIEKPERKLTGEYWTQRQSTGSVTLTFYSKDLLEELPAVMPSHPMAPD